MAESKSEEKKAPAKKTAAKKPAAKKTAAKKPAAANKVQAGKSKADKTVKVTLVKSIIGTRESHRATVRGLGLRRIRHSVELEDTPSVRGMINKVIYLLRVEG